MAATRPTPGRPTRQGATRHGSNGTSSHPPGSSSADHCAATARASAPASPTQRQPSAATRPGSAGSKPASEASARTSCACSWRSTASMMKTSARRSRSSRTHAARPAGGPAMRPARRHLPGVPGAGGAIGAGVLLRSPARPRSLPQDPGLRGIPERSDDRRAQPGRRGDPRPPGETPGRHPDPAARYQQTPPCTRLSAGPRSCGSRRPTWQPSASRPRSTSRSCRSGPLPSFPDLGAMSVLWFGPPCAGISVAYLAGAATGQFLPATTHPPMSAPGSSCARARSARTSPSRCCGSSPPARKPGPAAGQARHSSSPRGTRHCKEDAVLAFPADAARPPRLAPISSPPGPSSTSPDPVTGGGYDAGRCS